mgnify:CR=1 FL=1
MLHLALVFLVLLVGGLLLFVGLLERADHVLLEGLLLEHEAVFIPNEVGRLDVEGVALHALLEQIQNVAVVGVRREAQRPAELHVLFELVRLVQTQLVNRNLLLLALDIVIFFVLAASGQALPRQRAAQEVQQHVADGLEVVSARLFVANVRVERRVPGRAR